MRIAQIAPLWNEVSGSSAGLVERSIFTLTEALVQQRHSVTLFASGDSTTTANLAPVCQRQLRDLDPRGSNLHLMLTLLALEDVFADADEFDVIHVHAGIMALPLMRRSPTPAVATVHADVTVPQIADVYAEFQELCLVAVSPEQVYRLPFLNWQAIIPTDDPSDADHAGATVAAAGAHRLVEHYLRVYRQILGAPRLRPGGVSTPHSRPKAFFYS